MQHKTQPESRVLFVPPGLISVVPVEQEKLTPFPATGEEL